MKRPVEGVCFILNMSGMESSVNGGESLGWWQGHDKPAGATCGAGECWGGSSHLLGL